MSGDIKLAPWQRSFVDRQVSSGKFAAPQDVVAEGLRLLEARDERLVILDAMIAQGCADLDSGAYRDGDEVFDELEQRYAPRGMTRAQS